VCLDTGLEAAAFCVGAGNNLPCARPQIGQAIDIVATCYASLLDLIETGVPEKQVRVSAIWTALCNHWS
jgi:hypothetical protein